MDINKHKVNNETWDNVFSNIRLSKIPFPSKLSIEFYEKIRNYLPVNSNILEAGSGSGEISGYFAQKGHNTYLLDKSSNALTLSKRLYSKYKLNGNFVKADLFSIPFPDNTFDCVWNSGVLEHFDEKQIITALKEMSRVSKNLVITLVPNAGCVPYRTAKYLLEKRKKWPYGKESPKYTLYKQFEKSNLHVIKEEFVGTYSGIMWYQQISNISRNTIDHLSLWAEDINKEYINSGISYLILTLGTKKKSHKIIKNSNYILLDKENQIASLYSRINKLEKELYVIEHSRFWKIYRVLKKIKDSIRI